MSLTDEQLRSAVAYRNGRQSPNCPFCTAYIKIVNGVCELHGHCGRVCLWLPDAVKYRESVIDIRQADEAITRAKAMS